MTMKLIRKFSATSDKWSILEEIEEFAKRNDFGFDWMQAQTGTLYVTLDLVVPEKYYNDDMTSELDKYFENGEASRWLKTIKIRISDHMDAYGTSDYTISPFEGTWDFVKDSIIKLCEREGHFKVMSSRQEGLGNRQS